MFSALKYHAIDYLHEKVARQRFSFELFSIHIPPGLYQDKNYCHNRNLADDTYRRPWTRVTPDLTQIAMDRPVLDLWNKYLGTEDFLEEKPTSSTLFHVHNEDIEIVPSSNPGSPFDIEDAYVLMKNEDSYLNPKYAPVELEEPEEGFYIENEFVSMDYLAQYAKHLPTPHMLLSRINKFRVQKPFSVQEPLLNFQGDKITEEDIFRECFAFKMNVTSEMNVKSEAKGKVHQDNFGKVSLKNEETNSENLTCLELISSEIQEIIGNENENLKITSEDLEVKITPETENLESCPPQELCASQSRSVLELSRPEHQTSVPKCQQLSAIEFQPDYLQGGNTPMGETAKGNSPLAGDHVGLASQKGGRERRSTTDAHQGSSERPLSAHEDILEFSPLEKDDCTNLTETCARPCVLEELNTDLSAGDEVLHANVEVVSKMSTSQMDNLEVKITPETENLESCPPQELCASQSRSVLELSRPEHQTSVPKCQQLSAIEFQPDYLQGGNTPMGETAKGNSPLAGDHVGLAGQEGGREQRSTTDAHRGSGERPLSAHEDILEFSHLEKDDCTNLTETCARPCVLEELNTDLSAGDEVLHTNVDVVSKMSTSQMDKCLEETSSFANNRMESSSVPDCSGTKGSCLSSQKKERLLPMLLEPASGVDLQHTTSTVGDNSAPTEKIRKMKLQTETRKPGHFGNPEEENDQVQFVSYKEASTDAKNALGNNMPDGFDLPRKCRDDFDLLSNFIMLRSQHMIMQNEEPNNVDIQAEVLDAKEKSPTLENNISPLTLNEAVPMEKQTKENEEIVSIQIKASESQFQAYHILEAAVTPVLKELVSFGVPKWKFRTLNFDTTRYFLKQQEKVISDTFKQGVTGIKEGREIAVFKHAVALHLLVTVRDLLLTCNLNTALGYLFNAKDRYKDFLDSRLDNIYRLLEIVQISMQKQEVNPKIKELHHQMSKWVQSNMNDQNKVVIVTRMGFDEETDVLINTISTVHGLKIVYLDSEERGTFLESQDVISSLERSSCVVVYNQNIGPDFPWTHFSLVVEYNYSEKSCWLDICKNLNVSYITFITTVPETFGIEEVSPDNFGCVLLELPIPYVFLTSEGLLNTPEILQLLESKYNITFIERKCCEALQFFGSTDRYIVMTVDECTAIVIQNMEELGYEKSSDSIVLRLVVLSLQYSSCWIIFYSQERLNSEYSLAGKTLHHLTLIYGALVSFAQKSEDFDVKVVLTPGVEETALLVRQIADHILMTSQRHPQEWLDKSWLSVLPSEEEKSLFTFPCMNPLVAQVMLKKSSSLEWLLSATFDQLHALLPEVPEKVLKHFSDITSLYILNPPVEPKLPEETVSLQKNIKGSISSCSEIPFSKAVLSGFQGHSPFTEYFGNYGEVQNSKNCFPVYYQNESYTPLKLGGKHSSLIAPSLPYQEKVCFFQDNTGIEQQQYIPFAKKMEVEKRTTSSLLPPDDLKGRPHINFEATMPYLAYNLGGTNMYLENSTQNRMYRSKAAGQMLAHQDIENVLEVKKQPLVKQCESSKDSKSSWHLVSSREDCPIQQNSQSFLGELGATGYSGPKFQFAETFWGNQSSVLAMDSSPHDSSFSKELSSPDRFFNLDFPITGEYTRKKNPNVLSSNPRECVSAGLKCTQLPQLKKRRLTYEKDPGRSDGQTRLKFL
ncbi:Hypothetical predicted protein [Podarcis lilfordi]|uniref:Shortage in chiasmata 1 n=1 Tax=Podarcis lilfordi TaxID=74358 RepID=A0AA35PSU2_9SAUR|nr:Hypothetical predicted protein [Podarcis lilfordi]